MTNTTATLLAVDTAARKGNGDFYATKRALARFCTEALIDAAAFCVAGMTSVHRSKFCPSFCAWSRDRDAAIMTLCGYVSCVKLIAWGEAFEASCAAARAELPSALEALGAVL